MLRTPPSKLKPPTIGAPFVARYRLIDTVLQAGDVRLVLLNAPAGFGKTTLLRHLHDTLSGNGHAVFWLTLDASDNELDRFLDHLQQIFAQANRRRAPVPAAADGPPPGPGFELAQALASTPLPFVLVLDEFEHLHNPAVLAIVQHLIELLGSQQMVLIGTREQPLLNTARWRARRELLEIDAAQLRFRLDETSQFLCDKRNLQLDREDIERFQRVTDGWVAALWLSSLALEGSADPKRFIRTFSGTNTVVASYLAEEVLSHRPKEVQDFILQTSVLQKFCADSCDAITGRSDSRAMLQEIERSNMFLSALDEQRSWFSYHPLFAGFLRAQLDRQHPGLASELHRRAAAWYIGQCNPTAAIDHAVASGDRGLVLSLLQRHAEPLFLQGRVRLLARWFDTVDRSALAAHPQLVSVHAWSLIHTNRSAEALALLETLVDANGALPLSLSSYTVLKAFILMMLDRVDQTAALWEDPDVMASAAAQPFLKSMLMIGCAYYFATVGRYQEARLLLDRATREQATVGPLFSVAVGGYVHAVLDLVQGNLRTAGARLRTLIGGEEQARLGASYPRFGAMIHTQWTAPCPHYGAESGFASLYLAEVLYETNALDDAWRLLQLYLPMVKDAGIPDQLIASHVLHARIAFIDGRSGDALQTLLELEQLGLQRNLPRVVDHARMERARCALLEGKLELARSLLLQVGATPAWRRIGVQMIADDLDTPALAMLRLQLHNGHAATALPVFKELLHDAYARGRLRYALRIRALQALALSLAGQRNPALRAIRDALQDAAQEGFARIFLDEGPLMLALIRDMLDSMNNAANAENRTLRAFASNLVQLAPAAAPAPVAAPASAALPMSDVDLTAREMDVLQLLSQGFANQTIAEKMFVSITTVKTHLRNINLKLGTHTRTEAASIARSRGLIC